MKKWFQEPIHKTIDFWHDFSPFFVDFGTPWGPQGGIFFKKIPQRGEVFWPCAFFWVTFSFLGPLFEKDALFVPLGPHFGDMFGDFFVNVRHFWS